MLTRLLIVILCAVLALPVAATAPPALAGPHAQDAPALLLAAKGKKKKPRIRTRTVRQTVTQSFRNPTRITVPAQPNANASPYPGIVNVSGLTNGVITDVNLVLHGFSGIDPTDIGVLLVQAHQPSLNAVVINNIMDDEIFTNITLTLDDEAAAPLSNDDSNAEFPDDNAAYRFKPVNGGADLIWPNAPVPSGNAALSVFDGSTPNGTWQLFVTTDANGPNGATIAGGWSLEITADVDQQVKVKPKMKKKKN